MEASDRELIAGCLRGDAAAWERFVERFARLVHWSIRKSFERTPPGGREDFCREVFQDFFARLIDRKELSKLRDVGNVRKFLSVMACHLAMDRMKAGMRQSKMMRPVEEWIAEEEGASHPFLSEDERFDAEPAIEESLKGLSPKERACLQFFIVEGRTAAESAQILGISENTVHSVVRRSKEKLKAALLRKGYKNI